MLLASRLRDTFPFCHGWIVVGASSTVVFARMAPAITTLTVLIFPMSFEVRQSGVYYSLVRGRLSDPSSEGSLSIQAWSSDYRCSAVHEIALKPLGASCN